jgi:hypothetical protein
MRHGRLSAVILIIGVLVVPALALAAVPPRLAAGKWKISGGGGFTVGSDHKSISGLHLKPGAAANCGTAPISVLGTHKLAIASRGGYSNWIIGKSTPKTSSGVTPIKVTVRQAGQTMSGTLDLIFAVAGNNKDNSGYLTIGSACLLNLNATK